MLMLGDILTQARRSSSELLDWLQETDPELMARLQVEAAGSGETPVAFMRAAVAEFERSATEEDWATLTSSLRNTWSPGRACVTGMVKWRLAVASRAAEPQGEVADDG